MKFNGPVESRKMVKGAVSMIVKTPRGSGQVHLSGSTCPVVHTCPQSSDFTFRLPQIVRSVTGVGDGMFFFLFFLFIFNVYLQLARLGVPVMFLISVPYPGCFALAR